MKSPLHLLAKAVLCIALFSTAARGEPATGPRQINELFNGRDLSGWTVFNDLTRGDGVGTWTVRDGVIVCLGKPRGFLRTNNSFKDYRLRLQWRWPEKPGNSGVFLHGAGEDKIWPRCYEAQLASGNAGELRANGGALFQAASNPGEKSRPKLAPSSERPPGEWNDYEIVCRGETITLLINGVRQNDLEKAAQSSGWIALQSEGGPIEFRAITLESL
jgi:hypothetical protein